MAVTFGKIEIFKFSFIMVITPIQMAHADIIVPRGGDNEVAINLIVMHVIGQLQAVRQDEILVDLF